jgi:hypothetical protein
MVIRRIAEKHHAGFVPVGEFEAHDFGPEFRAALDVADAQYDVADLFDLDGSLFVCHRFLLC